MKKCLILILAGSLLFLMPSASNAQITTTGEFTLIANIPSATQIVLVVSRGKDGETWSSVGQGSQTLTFDMLYDTPSGRWYNDHFFVVDVSPRDSLGNPVAGTPDLQISYTDLVNQNNGGNPGGGTGLESKGVLTVVKVTGSGETQTEAELYKDTFGSVTTPHPVDESNFAGGYARMYLGLSDGTVGTPFTNGDQPGDYEGMITLTATID